MRTSGPWILGPPDRQTSLLVGLLRSLGFSTTVATEVFPHSGVVIVPVRMTSRTAEAERWASGDEGRTVVLEPSDGDPVPLSGVPRRLGQRRQIPAFQPTDRRHLDDAYLSELAAVALAGYKTRLERRRPFPDAWRAYAARAVAELATKTGDPETLASLQAELGPPADIEPVTDAEWEQLLEVLDTKRGLFRREGTDPGWQFHPRTLWAIATRIRRFIPSPVHEVEYGVLARGEAKGQWIVPMGPRFFRLRASIITTASIEVDPPDLTYPYDSSHDAPPPPIHELINPLGALTGPSLVRSPDEPFTLCIRHDVDRVIDRSDLERHVRLEDELGLRSTWFFKSETFDPGLASELIACDREIGYHAELVSTGDEGFVERLRDFLETPPGLSFHRGLGSEAWRGRRSIEEAFRLGVSYAEFPVGMRSRPQLLPVGDSEWLRVSPLAVEPEVHPERTREHLDQVMPLRGMVVVENHPDLFEESYASLLSRLVAEHPVCRTVGEAIAMFLPDVSLSSPTSAGTF